jgi:hypothetical protein
MMRALSGELHWFRAAEILGVDVRTMRRWREKFERNGCHALFDRRRQMPSPRRGGLWTLPRLCMAEDGHAQAAWTGRTDRRPAHSAHRRQSSDSGQFTC